MNRKLSIPAIVEALKQIFTVRWKPNQDLIAVAVSWLLVVAGISWMTHIAGQQDRGGVPYFIVYAVITAALCGIGLPLYWTVIVRRRPLSELGMTRKWLHRSHFIQLFFVALQFAGLMGKIQFPPIEQLLPLIGLAMFIGFFETVFWRGWVQTRLEAAFGILPSIVLSAALYAVHYLAYGASFTALLPLFFAGLLYGIVFRLTKNVLIIWPVFLPMRLLIILLNDGITIPPLAVLGLFGAWLFMLGLIRLAGRYHQAQNPLSLWEPNQMQSLKNLSNLIVRYTNTRNFIVSLVLFILITGTMEVCPFGSVHLRSISNGVGMLDMLSGGYSPTLVYGMFEQIGAAGRVGYAQVLGLDVIFALVYMCLHSLLTTLLLRGSRFANQWLLLNLLPVVRSGLDLLENALLLTLLFSYPAQLERLVNIASSVTVAKWVVYIIILALIAALGIYVVIKNILARLRSRALPE